MTAPRPEDDPTTARTDAPTGRPEPAVPAGPETVDWDAEEARHDGWRDRSGPASGSRRWWIVGITAVVLMSVLAVWFGISAATGKVQWVNTGHEIVSDRQVDVRFDLRRDPTREVVCELEAQDTHHAVIGRTEVRVGSTPASPSRHVESVRTASAAVTGYVHECWYADEAPPANR